MFYKWRESFGKHREIITYLIVGILTTIVSWIAYAFCKMIFDVNNVFQMQVSVIVRWITGLIFAYVTNRIFVFRSKNSQIHLEMLSFASSRVVTLIMDMVIMWILPSMLGIDDWISTFISTIMVTVTNYLFSKFFVFHKRTYNSI